MSDRPILLKVLLKQRRWLEQIAVTLQRYSVSCEIVSPRGEEDSPILEIALPSSATDAALRICRQLRRGQPAIYVGHGKLRENRLVVHPLHLNDKYAAVLADRLCEEIQREDDKSG